MIITTTFHKGNMGITERERDIAKIIWQKIKHDKQQPAAKSAMQQAK